MWMKCQLSSVLMRRDHSVDDVFDDVFDVDGITGSVRIPSMMYLGTAAVQRLKISVAEKAISDPVEELVTRRCFSRGLHPHGIKTRINLLRETKHSSRVPFGSKSCTRGRILFAIGRK